MILEQNKKTEKLNEVVNAIKENMKLTLKEVKTFDHALKKNLLNKKEVDELDLMILIGPYDASNYYEEPDYPSTAMKEDGNGTLHYYLDDKLVDIGTIEAANAQRDELRKKWRLKREMNREKSAETIHEYLIKNKISSSLDNDGQTDFSYFYVAMNKKELKDFVKKNAD